MASSEQKTAAGEMPVEQKLKALYDLQQVSSKIDKIRTVRGELPLEVKDLEDEVAGLGERVSNLNDDIKKLNDLIVEHKNKIKEAEANIKKYEEQQNAVRNNREFDAISKEIEYQDLDMQVSEKRIKEFSAEIHKKQELVDQTRARIAEREGDLENKRAELQTIIAETKQEEEALEKEAEEHSKKIDERTLQAFTRIREKAHNGLAVATIHFNKNCDAACGGCFNRIPPQRVQDIALRKKVIVCEYCGRILVDFGMEMPTVETKETKKK